MKKFLQIFLVTALALQAYNLKAQTCTGVDTVIYPYYKEEVFSAPDDSFFVDAMIGTVRTASEAYHLSDTMTVTGVQFWASAYSTTGFPQTLQVMAYLYNVDVNNMPTTVIDSATVTITEQYDLYEAYFTTPDTVTGNFAVAVRSFVNDTLGVVTNNAGASWQPIPYNEGLAWRRFGSGVWNSALSFFGQDLEYMIFPIVSYSITPSFTASADTVCSGDNVFFTNTTSGLPLDRMFNLNTFAEYWGFTTVDSSYAWDFGTGLSYSTNSSYPFSGNGVRTATLYTNMTGYYFACTDSASMDILVNPSYAINTSAAICPGDSVFFAGNYVMALGTYYDSLQTVEGCDSVIILDLSFNPTYGINTNASVCPGDSLLFGGNYLSVAGTYYDSLQTVNGCDSIIILDLAISPTYSINTSASICPGDSLLFGGNYLTAAGTYYDSLQSVNGCDSVMILDLSINATYSMNTNAAICQGDSLLFGGNYLAAAGTYYDTLQTVNGCDSVIILDLAINPLPAVSLALSTDTVCDIDPAFALTGGTPAGGVYSGTGVSAGNFDPAAAGAGSHTIVYMYTDSNGCVNSDSADIFVDICLGVQSVASNTFSVYPNPSGGQFVITMKYPAADAQLVILNDIGEKVYSEYFSGSSKEIHCNLAGGIYTIRIVTEKGNSISKLLIE